MVRKMKKGGVSVLRCPATEPKENAANWIQTRPGKGWFGVLRLYGPLEPWFDQSWRPGEIVQVSASPRDDETSTQP